jgi:hypothetical protein
MKRKRKRQVNRETTENNLHEFGKSLRQFCTPKRIWVIREGVAMNTKDSAAAKLKRCAILCTISLSIVFFCSFPSPAQASKGKAVSDALTWLAKQAYKRKWTIFSLILPSEDEFKLGVQWSMLGTNYAGVLVIDSSTGIGVFHTFINGTPAIVQDIEPRFLDENNVLLLGSNPRIADSNTPAYQYYSADQFWLRRISEDKWSIANCDQQGLCAPVAFNDALLEAFD